MTTVARPVLTREQQLAAISRRYGSGTIALKPSDPDFVYPLPSVQIRLHVPESYPSERPTIDVLNRDIPRWACKVLEEGFRKIALRGDPERWIHTTLMDLLRIFDRELEGLLSEQREDQGEEEVEPQQSSSRTGQNIPTAGGNGIKIVRNLAPPKLPATPPPPQTETIQTPIPKPIPAVPIKPSYTSAQTSAAAAIRQKNIRQLESRLKLSPLFSSSSSGGLSIFTIPLEAAKKNLLPVPMQTLQVIRLIIPKLYNLEPPIIEVPDVSQDLAENVERQWDEFVRKNPDVGLTAAVNVLAAKIHLWAIMDKKSASKQQSSEKKETEKKEGQEAESQEVSSATSENPEKPHIKHIPRPPEWAIQPNDNNESDDSGDSEYDSDSGNSENDDDCEHSNVTETAEQPAGVSGAPSQNPERGTSLSCPGIQMTGIDLLEVGTLNLSIKCARCKTEQQVTNLKGTRSNERPMPRALRCGKCAEVLGIGFRKEFTHQSSTRLGFFDLINCTIAELMPLDLSPQCSECASDELHQEIKGVVRGQAMFSNCRNCFKRMSLLIPEFKLLRIGSTTVSSLRRAPLPKSDKERYVAGTELPNKGKCKHYRKSTRWFRFSCCGKVFPCDKCHDEAESHISEHANRMICGMCSREQNYRPEDCRFCGNLFLKAKMGRFWEGGKGTRDQVLMSRNDPRKFKRRGPKAALEKKEKKDGKREERMVIGGWD